MVPTVVIPVYNALPSLQAFLGMLDANYPDRALVLVNDCSSDVKVAEFLLSYAQKPSTVAIARSRRGWFTRSANTGLRYVLNLGDGRPEWVFVMNSDCTLAAGGFEELLEVWKEIEKDSGKKVGLVGADGPKPHCPRFKVVREPGYVTGHALLFSTKLMVEQNLLFPWKDGQVKGFSAQSLVHINSDRALSYEFNRRGYLTVISYWAAIGHLGGHSWNHRLGDIPDVRKVGED